MEIKQLRRKFVNVKQNDFILGTHPKIQGRAGKEFARERLIRAVLSQDFEKVKALTNPSAWWVFERELARNCSKFSCVGIERDPNLFKMGVMRIPKNNKPIRVKYSEETKGHAVTNGKGFCLLNGDIHTFLAAPNTRNIRFNFVWLDLGEPINLKLISSIRQLPNWLQDKAVIAIDALALREALEITRLIKGDRLGFFKNEIPKLIPLSVLDVYRYADHYKSPMIQGIYLYNKMAKV